MKTYSSDPFIKKVDEYYFIILTNTHFGTNNGYIAVPLGHYLHSKEYDQINDEYNFNVHWGLTYSGPFFKDLFNDDLGVDSIDRESLEKYWLIGFDCLHCDDFIPYYGEIEVLKDIYDQTAQTFKDRDFVMNELENLLKQIELQAPKDKT